MAKKKQKIDFKNNLKIFFGFLKNYKILTLIVLLTIAIVESTKIIDKYILKLLIDKSTDYINDVITQGAFIQFLIYLGIAYAVIIVLATLSRWVYLHTTNRLDSALMLDLKRKAFNHIISLSHRFHTSNKTGSLITRIIRGANAIEKIADAFIFNIVPMIIQMTLVTTALFMLNMNAGIVVFLTALIFIAYSFYINHIQQSSKIKSNDTEDYEKGILSDYISNIETIKYFGKEATIKRKYYQLAKKTKKALLKFWDYFRWYDAGQWLILSLGTFFVIYFPLLKFINKQITVGELVFAYTVFASAVPSLGMFVWGMRNFYEAMGDFQSLFRYFKVKKEIKDMPDAKELKIKDAVIEFKNINFKYKNKAILRNFNLKIPKNKSVAFVGPSGAGKSTIIKLLFRLYDSTEGQVLIDDHDIKTIKQESLRSELSIVPQECILFDDTVYNNIRFSNPRASKEEVFKAIKLAQLKKVIKNFPKQENTIVGERGIKLSGGEKQRVSMARAILADKKILVLDEATSSLDSETEYYIQKALDKLMKNRTTIIIAHRLSTVMKADMIVVMNKGKILQIGTHRELLKHGGLYKRLWNLQKGGYL